MSRQLAASKQMLQRRVQGIVGLQPYSARLDQQWFYRAELTPIGDRRDLLLSLSKICEDVYNKAPRIANELVRQTRLEFCGCISSNATT